MIRTKFAYLKFKQNKQKKKKELSINKKVRHYLILRLKAYTNIRKQKKMVWCVY